MNATPGATPPGHGQGLAGIGLHDAAEGILAELADAPDLVLLAVGWATVDTDRAEAEAAAAVELAGSFVDAPGDEILGAHARVGSLASGLSLIILEPATEGRLAAFLARHGEGIAAVYVSAPGGGIVGQTVPRSDATARVSGRRDGFDGPGRPHSRGPAPRPARAAAPFALGPRRPGPLGVSRHLAGSRHGPHVVLVEGTRPAPGHGAALPSHHD